MKTARPHPGEGGDTSIRRTIANVVRGGSDCSITRIVELPQFHLQTWNQDGHIAGTASNDKISARPKLVMCRTEDIQVPFTRNVWLIHSRVCCGPKNSYGLAAVRLDSWNCTAAPGSRHQGRQRPPKELRSNCNPTGLIEGQCPAQIDAQRRSSLPARSRVGYPEP